MLYKLNVLRFTKQQIAFQEGKEKEKKRKERKKKENNMVKSILLFFDHTVTKLELVRDASFTRIWDIEFLCAASKGSKSPTMLDL